jgi:hypothetical protein
MSVVYEGRRLVFEAGDIQFVVEKGLYDGVSFFAGGHGMGIEMVFPVQVIEDEFSIVIRSQLQVIACGTFDGDRGVGKADGNVVPLPGPGKVFDEVPGLGECPLFAVGEFAGFVVF